jgi:outer membrane murein-binding lipoprotein Lpp
MTGKLDEISKAIGELGADVRNLTKGLEQSDHDAADARDRADNHRGVIHARVEDLAAEIFSLANKVESMDVTVKDSKAVTDQVKMWQQRGIGALAFAGIAGTALGGTVVGFIAYWWDAIMRVLRAA